MLSKEIPEAVGKPEQGTGAIRETGRNKKIPAAVLFTRRNQKSASQKHPTTEGTLGIGGERLRVNRGAWIGVAGAFAAAAAIVAVYAAVVPTGQTLPAGSKATPFALTL